MVNSESLIWIPEEQPNFVINMLNNFFGGGGVNLK
jgi:hypothetical protein